MRQLFFIIIVLLSHYSLAEGPEGYPFISFDQALKQAKQANMPMFIYFGRYGCGYCEKTNKEAFIDPTVKSNYTEHYILAYVDSESGKRLRLPSGERITERELGTRYKAFVTPVFSFLNSKGQQIHQLVGVQTIDTLLEADKKVQAHLKNSL